MSLAVAFHHDYHHRRNRRAVPDPDYELPGLHGASYIATGTDNAARSGPTGALADAIDRRAGWPEIDLEYEARMAKALLALAVYDPVMCDVVHLVCVQGRVSLKQGGPAGHGHGMQHHDWERAARLIAGSADPDAGDPDRRVWDWLAAAWQLLAVLASAPDEVRARAAGEADVRTACEKLRGRGLWK